MVFNRKRVILIVLSLAMAAVLVLTACQGAAGTQGPQGPAGPAGQAGPAGVTQDDVKKAIDERFTTYDGNLPLWAIQSGTAPRMVELTIYFNNMWFGAQAGNWDLARFEAYRSEEATKAVYVTRAKRITTLKPWAESALPVLIKAIESKDKAEFEKAYDVAIAGCNGCHAGSSGGPLKSMATFKITRPTTPLFSNIDYKGP